MSSKTFISSSIFFALGLAGGAVIGYFYSKNKYLAMADKEIESVKKVYQKYFETKPSKTDPTPSSQEQPTKSITPDNSANKEYKKYAQVYGGNNPAPKIGTVRSTIAEENEKKQPVKTNPDIYVITPEEFADSEYKSETLMYYADKVLADEDGNIIKNINEVIGPEALSTFGRYDDNVVYVRNEAHKIDYEIIWDSRRYSVLNKLPGDNSSD